MKSCILKLFHMLVFFVSLICMLTHVNIVQLHHFNHYSHNFPTILNHSVFYSMYTLIYVCFIYYKILHARIKILNKNLHIKS